MKNKETRIKYIKAALFFTIFMGVLAIPARIMGLANMLNTMMNTAYRLLIDTCFYIMAIAVLAGAVSTLFSEFGVIELLNKLLSPLMQPLWGMPGASALGIVTCYMSDNPAILALADDMEYRSFFRTYQIPALTNLGTSFGMGLIVTSCMLGLNNITGGKLTAAVLCGNLGAIVGSIVSTRIMLFFSRKTLGNSMADVSEIEDTSKKQPEITEHSENGLFMRIINALLSGGKTGVEMGIGIIPGVCIICTIVMMLTNGPSASGVYTGAAYEGIRLLPLVGDKLSFILTPLFGFSSSECISVPVTAMGSAGAALSTVRTLAENGNIGSGDIAVFTAMCMCWSGYLSTHCSMMDVLGCRDLTSKSILSHTIGGLCAGISAHLLFLMFQ